MPIIFSFFDGALPLVRDFFMSVHLFRVPLFIALLLASAKSLVAQDASWEWLAGMQGGDVVDIFHDCYSDNFIYRFSFGESRRHGGHPYRIPELLQL